MAWQGVAGGRFGSAVSLWDEGIGLVGAPHAETSVSCCGSKVNARVRAGTAHFLEVRHCGQYD